MKRSGPGRTVNKTEAAELFGVTAKTVDNWMRKGLKGETQGREVLLNTAAIAQFLEDDIKARFSATPAAETIDQARIRKITADAALAELQLERERGEVVNIEEVARAIGDEYAATRAKLLSIPTKLAPRIAIESDENACRELLAREITEALNELVGAGFGEGSPREPEAAADSDGVGMGGSVPAPVA